ncbi:MAG: hypothetical protein RMH81_06005 [Thermomicrobium sp.]|nr:hypothetical protein [Thermomicrobium sp.]
MGHQLRAQASQRQREWTDQDILTVVAVGSIAVLWPVGVLITWATPRWRLVDKIIATLIPVGGLMLSLLVLPAGERGLGLSAPGLRNWLVEFAQYAGLMGAPLVASLFLGLRAGLPRRVMAGLLGLALIALALGQLAFFLGSRLHPGGA